MSEPEKPALPQLYTVAEVARALRQTERFVREKARLRLWPCRRLARGQVAFNADDFAKILDLCAQPAVDPEPQRISFAPRSRNRPGS